MGLDRREYLDLTEMDPGASSTALMTDNSTNNSRKKKILIIVGILVIALCLGLGLGLGLGLKDSSPLESGCTYYKTDNSKNKNQNEDDNSREQKQSRFVQEDCPASSLQCPDGYDRPPLIIVSLDGFRADYITRNLTPVLNKIGNCGVRTNAMRSVFPTKTFPNHFSIVTGLYPESHGIIDNRMYDIELGRQFSLNSEEKFNPDWWSGEPIWNTVKKHGKKSAVFFWPGSEIKLDGLGPDYCYLYDGAVPFDARVDTVLGWLDLPVTERPEVIALYLSEPDKAGHEQGPFGDLVNEKVVEVDGLVGKLMDGLIDRGLDTCANVIVVSDHGMSPIDCDRTVLLTDRFPGSSIYDYYIYDGPVARVTSQYKFNFGEIVHVEDGDTPDQILERFQCSDYNNTFDWYMNAYKKEDLPKRFHYASNHRIDEVVLTAADQWLIQRTSSTNCHGGQHGWDNTFHDMQALFVALGPGFKTETEVEPFENIELYHLMAEMLDVTPAPNNGTLGSLRHLLSNPRSDEDLEPEVGSQYSECPYPDSNTADERRDASDCDCDTSAHTTKTIEELDDQLDLSDDEISESLKQNLVYGAPILTLKDESICQLAQTEYVTAFNPKTHLASWVAYTLNKPGGSGYPSEWRSSSEIPDCVRTDVRLSTESTAQCSELQNENIIIGFLYHPGFSVNVNQSFDAYITSNMVPMFKSFRNDTWTSLLELLEEYSLKFEKIQIYMGPIYDYNYDGKGDTLEEIPSDKFINDGRVPLPSHYFAVALRCDDLSDAGVCADTSEVISVILPHKETEVNCWNKETDGQFRNIMNNVARVRDVELLTGLRFFPDLDGRSRVRLQTHMDVWERITWMDQVDVCPDEINAECAIPGYNSSRPPVLLISIDGLRAEYLQRNFTPVLQKLADCGVNTDYMNSVYPTLTFPNHYSIVTGLYTESHGIVDNNMYDTDLNIPFSIGGANNSEPAWWGGDPIWNTAERQNRTSMSFFWVGSDEEIEGMRPSRYFPYNSKVPNEQRVDQILKWISGSEDVLPDLMLMYFEIVDKAGHDGGPESLQVKEALEVVDSLIGQLMDGLYRLNMHNCLNIIITSDHGMADLSCDKQVLLKDSVEESAIEKLYLYAGPAGRISNTYIWDNRQYIEIEEGQRVPVDEIVQNTSCASPYMNVYTKYDLPTRFHYTNNPRIDQIVAVMDDTWTVDRYEPWCFILGNHGWDPNFDAMKAIFIAHGPSFKAQFTTEPFENIEIYNLVADLLNITASPNNGTQGSLSHILKSPTDVPDVEGSVDYEDWEFPSDGEEYETIVNSSLCRCGLSNDDLFELDDNLNTTQEERTSYLADNIPHGVPAFPPSEQLYLLQQEDYITGYSDQFFMPKWVAFSPSNFSSERNNITSCPRSDVRLDLNLQPSCLNFTDYIPVQLYPSGFTSSDESVSDSSILTNVVPMIASFANGIWDHLLTETIGLWAQTLDDLYIIFGPAFDYNADSLPDESSNITRFVGDSNIPVPSHFYAIVLQCAQSSGDCSDMDFNVQAYLLPHRENLTNCMSYDRYLYDNRVRIRDIELITGLEFLTLSRTLESVRTRTAAQPNRQLQTNL